MRTLVLVHGRAQQGKDPATLKREWLEALNNGFAAADVELDLPDDRVRFPYYGDTLAQLVEGSQSPAEVIVMSPGAGLDAEEKQFIGAAVADAVLEKGVTEAQIRAEVGDPNIEAGPQNWPWVIGAVKVLAKLPGLGGPTLAAVTRDVFHYLRRPGVARPIDAGVLSAMETEGECVVVAHSLGAVVAYNVLRRRTADAGWTVPSLVTVGCPLAVEPIVEALSPIGRPAGVAEWFNAFDTNDIVALHPLDERHFGVQPPVENYDKVDNDTPNQHGITGYLSDPVVARRIYEALMR